MSPSLSRAALVFVLLLTAAFGSLHAQNARIVEWVEDAPVTDTDKIALGYPVPIPVDSPLPFDGFRSYAGLHARHQDLSITTSWVHPHEIGQTRNGRTIWAYRLGDADRLTSNGQLEHAMLSNGGIHAREWQSPEVTTGIMELIALSEDDHHLIDYLRDNANIIVIPVLNIDGFLQTQRFPRRNWLGTDLDDPDNSPRDGRMRRKNMLGPDENLLSRDDHLLGVDLNRNNPPFWASNPNRSSSDPESIVHHGAFGHSEPETQALVAALELAPTEKLSMYTDLHSFSQVHFWVRNNNRRLARLTEDLLQTFSGHHRSFPAGKNYVFSSLATTPVNQGIGLTEEYFTFTHQVPSWTLEIEPSGAFHPELPGQGADYGGLGRNGHDGFILPESEVERVRTELAQSFAVAYYRQSGPPAITAFQLRDQATGAVVVKADWEALDSNRRQLHTFQSQPVQLGREYSVWVAWDKPMRWRIDGEVAPLPGQPPHTLDFEQATFVGDSNLNALLGDETWLDDPALYLRYRDDSLVFNLTYLDNETNRELVQGRQTATFVTSAYDMTGYLGDADPSTAARWENGGWSGYENTAGNDLGDTGGKDATIQYLVSPEDLGDPFVIEPGISATWFDPNRDGEGFVIEILDDTSAVMYWFTYDSKGNQDWYLAEGEIQGNRIVFPELVQVSGGEFGPDYDPDKVTTTVVGTASFIWSSCSSGEMDWTIHRDGEDPQRGRSNLLRLTYVMGLACGRTMLPPERPERVLSGSWYDPSHLGEGYAVEVLFDQRVLVYWFSFDPDGNRRWFYGTGEIIGDKLVFEEMLTTRGGVFGAGFDPTSVEVAPWGYLELELECAQGIARFEPSEDGFPDGSLDLDRLTSLAGLPCGN
jgi:hypothetical protein